MESETTIMFNKIIYFLCYTYRKLKLVEYYIDPINIADSDIVCDIVDNREHL